MRKLLACLMILSLLCSAALADSPAYLGAWIRVDEFMEGKTDVNFMQLLEDHSVFYFDQWFFSKGSIGIDERNVFTWEEIDDHTFRIIKNGVPAGPFTMTDDDHLDSGHARVGAVPFLYHVQEKEKEEEEKQKEKDLNPVGMWSFFWDARELNEILGKNRMSFDIQAFNLYLLDDGSAYMQKASVMNGKQDFSPELISGIWIGDRSDMTIKVGTNTNKAWIDDSGRLFYKMTDEMAFVFSKVPLYDYEEGFINE